MIELVIRFFGSLTLVFYLAYLLPFRLHKRALLVLPVIVAFIFDIITFVMSRSFESNFFINILLSLTVLLFFKNQKSGIFYLVVLETMLLISDGLTYYLEELILSTKGLILVEGTKPSILGHLTLYCIFLILLSFCAIRLKKLQQYDVPGVYWLYFSAIPMGSIYLLYFAFSTYIYAPIMSYGMIPIVIVTATMNVINIHMYSSAISYYATKLANQTLLERVNIFAQKQNSLVETYKNLRTIQHNIKNDLVPVLTAIGENQLEAADDKLREIIGAADLDIFVSNTGIDFIDDMIDYKASIAREKNIGFNVTSELDAVPNLNYLDISSIIGTALDNAIDACAQMTEAKTVDICVTARAGLFMVEISNPSNGDILPDKAGGFLSTKRDGKEHGFGIVSIKKLVEKNGGELRIEYPEGRFVLSVVFYGK